MENKIHPIFNDIFNTHFKLPPPMEDNNTTTNCPTCGHLRETFTSENGTSGFVPPVESKLNEESKAINDQHEWLRGDILSKLDVQQHLIHEGKSTPDLDNIKSIIDPVLLRLFEANGDIEDLNEDLHAKKALVKSLQSQLAECRKANFTEVEVKEFAMAVAELSHSYHGTIFQLINEKFNEFLNNLNK